MYLNSLCTGTERVDSTQCINCSSIASCPLGSTYYVDMDMCRSGNESLLTIDKLCKTCRKCPAGYWEKSPCTLFSDRECVKCTVCGATGDQGTYMVKPCGKFADTNCTKCTQCKEVVERLVHFMCIRHTLQLCNHNTACNSTHSFAAYLATL
jgi:hypothetical protein